MNLFERFPEEDGAEVFWSALHGMEAVGGYEDLLLQYFRRHPSLMTRALLRRILNSGQTHIGRVAISSLIDDVVALTRALQRTAAPLGRRTVRVIWPRLLQPTGRFRRRSLSLVVRPLHTP